MKRLLSSLSGLLLMASLVLTGCPTDVKTVSVTGVSVTPEALSIVAGETGSFTVAVTPTDATNAAFTVESSDTDIATVTKDGVTVNVTAVAAGSATITVTTSDGAKTASCAVTVTAANVAVESITVNPSTSSILVEGTQALSVSFTPSDATNKNVTWVSSNPAIATVDGDGVVTAVAAGSAIITATSEDGAKTATCAVTVTEEAIAATAVAITDPVSTNLVTGGTLTLAANKTPADSTDKIIWSSSATGVATVSAAGVVTAVAPGQVTITARANASVSDTIDLTVDPTVAYNLNYDGASGAPADQVVPYGETATAPTEPTRDGYTFDAWYEDADGTTAYDFATAVTADDTLYAKWTPVDYTITYKLDGGTNDAANPTKYTVETATISLADATLAGKFFAGWYTENTFENEVSEITLGSTGDITLYAKFNMSIWSIWEGSVDLGKDWDTSLGITPKRFADCTVDTEYALFGTVGSEGYHQVKLSSNEEGWPVLATVSAALGANEYDCISFNGILNFTLDADELAVVQEHGLRISGYDATLTKLKIMVAKAPVSLTDAYTNNAGRSVDELRGYSDDALVMLGVTTTGTPNSGWGIGALMVWNDGWSNPAHQSNINTFNADDELAAGNPTMVALSLKAILDEIDALAAEDGADVVGYGFNAWSACNVGSITIYDFEE